MSSFGAVSVGQYDQRRIVHGFLGQNPNAVHGLAVVVKDVLAALASA